ncbi:tail assembly protein [Luteibacter jiangsuensis]|uniref:Tail assembly protein n=1 Tax=Luteibacter jiangsuensis TaxID=637577 RepID=A0ABX0QB99_9GAMM|nr:tail assembly protein [Luteibacter jiangsuensis]NID06662.1 tail assembly protein [Luteibacter jiangsuensis]
MSPTTVLLSGPLRKRFGREFKLHLDTKTPAEAIQALCIMIDGFRAYLLGAADRGVEFAVWRGRGEHAENIGVEQLREPAGSVIRIAPVHVGAKNGGVLTTIVGAVLIIVGVIGMYTPFGQAFGGAAWGPFAIKLGVAMVAGGVVQMLSPQPKMGKGSADSANNQASYIFNGPVNVTAQGAPVPILYGGPMEIGSVVASAGIEAVDYSSRPSNVGFGTPGGNGKKTPYDPD